jgi:exodeoxyribonuclease V gamma subunit
LHVRLADRSLRQTNPLLDVVARLLELADARVTASQVLDLVALPPLRRRFRLDDGDLERLAEWVSTSGVRWGLDAEHRAPYAMANVRQNTWQTGLDRLLLGVTMPEDDLRPLDLALPLDDVDSGDIDLAGRLAEVVDRLASVLDELSGEHSLGHWLDTLAYALDALTDVNEADAWQLTQARRELGDVATVAGQRADLVSLALADVRALLADRLQGRPTRANFRTGNLTMCSMVPMRSVPHRVICLFGLDDGVFPRAAGIDGDDVLARDPMVGERDRRSEDRQLLLDAILAAEETLVMLYTGADERTGATRPPAVPLGELLDVVDATVQTRDARLGREHVVVRQPLQTFDPRNFEPGRLGTPGPFSHDRGALAGARAATRPRRAEPPLLASPLPAYEDADGVVPLDRLVHFLEHPVRGFFVHRLGITAPKDVEQIDDALHADLVGLDRWAVGDRWLTARLTGADTKTAEHAEWLRGSLPPGALGQAVLTEVINEAEPLVTASMADRSGEPESHDVSVTLPRRPVVAGTIDGVYGCTLARTVYSARAQFRIRAWVQLSRWPPPAQRGLAGCDDRARPQTGQARATFEPLAAAPLTRCARHAGGAARPGPAPTAATAAGSGARVRLVVVRRRHRGVSLRKAAKEWPDSFSGAKDEWHQRLWGDAAPFALVNEGTQVSRPGARTVVAASRRRVAGGRVSAPAPFNVCGPLPSGTTVLEASAGTGKTFTIAALATRYVAEGHAALGELMLVTFGRAATQELRERVRDRLVTAERGLASPARAATSDDDLLRLLADADAAEVELRRKRLASALADFDAATIATTHAFCQQMLVGLGLSGDFEPHAVFVEDIDDIVTEVVDDLYLRKWGGPDSEPALFTYAQALSLARKVITDRHAALRAPRGRTGTPQRRCGCGSPHG